eukprot:216144-Amphidinium_carterae.1
MQGGVASVGILLWTCDVVLEIFMLKRMGKNLGMLTSDGKRALREAEPRICSRSIASPTAAVPAQLAHVSEAIKELLKKLE